MSITEGFRWRPQAEGAGGVVDQDGTNRGLADALGSQAWDEPPQDVPEPRSAAVGHQARPSGQVAAEQ
jgi:hypothetical protein